MNKNKKFLIFAIYFTVLVLAFLLCVFIFTEKGNYIALTIFGPKYYIKFNDLEKVTISYNPDNSLFENHYNLESHPKLQNVGSFEVEVTDKEFLNLIEDTYQNKIVTDYFTGGILSKGNFTIKVSDDFEISTYKIDSFMIDYKGKWIEPDIVNKKLYETMVQIVINNYIEPICSSNNLMK